MAKGKSSAQKQLDKLTSGAKKGLSASPQAMEAERLAKKEAGRKMFEEQQRIAAQKKAEKAARKAELEARFGPIKTPTANAWEKQREEELRLKERIKQTKAAERKELAKQAALKKKAQNDLLKKEMEANMGKTWVEQYRKGNTVVKGHWRKLSKDATTRTPADKAKLEKIYKNMKGQSDKEQLRLSKDITKFGTQPKPADDIYRNYLPKSEADKIKREYDSNPIWKDSGYAIDEKGRVFMVKDKEITNARLARDYVADYARKAGYKVYTDSYVRPGSKKFTVSEYLEVEKPVRVRINGRWETKYQPMKTIRFSDHETGKDRASMEVQINKNWSKSPTLTPDELYKIAKEI